MKFLAPLIFAVAGVGAGAGAAVALRSDPGDAGAHDAAEAQDHGATTAHGESMADHGEAASGHEGGDGEASAEYVKLDNQFIVPILEEARVRSLVVLSVDLEIAPGRSQTVYQTEPKIRDAFLTVLFDHANAGGFTGAFTSSGAMDVLRSALREAGQKAVGGDVLTDVLITSIVRQDV